MTRKFESDEDRVRERETLTLLTKEKLLQFKLMDTFCAFDAKLYKDNKLLSIAEVKTYKSDFEQANLHVILSLKKMANIQDYCKKWKIPCCFIYRFNDRIGYYFLHEIKNAKCEYGGRNEIRNGSTYDRELLIKVPKKSLKFLEWQRK